jgi:hypothetical protein
MGHPIRFSVKDRLRIGVFQGEAHPLQITGTGYCVADLRSHAATTFSSRPLPENNVHIVSHNGWLFENDVKLDDLPMRLLFVLRDDPLIFIRVRDSVIEYTFVEGATVGDAKMDLALDHLMQSGTPFTVDHVRESSTELDDSQFLQDLPNMFKLTGILSTDADLVHFTVRINDQRFESFTFPSYGTVAAAKRAVCEKFVGLGSVVFTLHSERVPTKNDAFIVDGCYDVVSSDSRCDLSFRTGNGTIELPFDILRPIMENRDEIGAVLNIDRPRFFIGDVRLNRFEAWCFYRIKEEIRVEPSPQKVRVRMPDGLSQSLSLPAGSRVVDLRQSLRASADQVLLMTRGRRLDDDEILDGHAEIVAEKVKPLAVLVEPTMERLHFPRDNRTVQALIMEIQRGRRGVWGVFDNEQRLSNELPLSEIRADEVLAREVRLRRPVPVLRDVPVRSPSSCDGVRSE